MEPIRAARVVLVATGEGVGHLSGTTYLASFGASTLLHGTKLQLGVVHDRLAPLVVEDEDGQLHFADAAALAAVAPGLSVVSAAREPVEATPLVLGPDTFVELLAPQSSVVICASMRSSSATLDPYRAAVLLDRSRECVVQLIHALNTPYRYPWGKAGAGPTVATTVFLTVVAEAGTGWDTSSTIVHCVRLPLAKDELERLLRVVSDGLRNFEATAAHAHATGDLDHSLRTGAFMMGLLPPSLRSSLVVVADGVASTPDLSVYDNPLMLMNRQGMTCHVVQTAAYQPFQALGCVPSCESLQQLAMSTGGYYFDMSSNAELTALENQDAAKLHSILMHSLLVFEWTPALTVEDAIMLPRASYSPLLRTQYQDERNVLREMLVEPSELLADLHSGTDPYPWEGSAPPVHVLRHRMRDYHTSSESWSLMSARLHEGFRFLSLDVGQVLDESADFTLSLWLAWLPNVKLVYTIQSSVDVGHPHSAMQRPSSVQIFVYAPYEFLMRLTAAVAASASSAAVSKKQQRRNPGIEAVLLFIKRVVRTDRVLNHVAVNSSAILSTCDPDTGLLPAVHQSAFWQIITSLGDNPWQRWFLLRRVMFVLRPDKLDLTRPVAAEEIQFTAARSSLLSVCKEWAFFALSSHTAAPLYCRLVGRASDGRPTGFCLLRPIFVTKSLAVLQFAVFGASQLHMDTELELFLSLQSARGRVAQLEVNFVPALLWGDEDASALQSMLPSVQMFGGPSPPRLTSMEWYRSWRWVVPDATVRSLLLSQLRRHRLSDGFYVLSWLSGAFVTELTHPSSQQTACLQWRARELGDSLTVETWMEPIYGWGSEAFEAVANHLRSNDTRIARELYSWRAVLNAIDGHEPAAVPGAPEVSAAQLASAARSTLTLALPVAEVANKADRPRLFTLLCRSLALLSNCPIMEPGVLPPTSFACWLYAGRDLVIAQASPGGDSEAFSVVVSECRQGLLGRPQRPADELTCRLLNMEPVSDDAKPKDPGGSSAKVRGETRGVLGHLEFMHHRNAVRLIYWTLLSRGACEAPALNLALSRCVSFDFVVNVTDLLCLSNSLEANVRNAAVPFSLAKAVRDVHFSPIGGDSCVFFFDKREAAAAAAAAAAAMAAPAESSTTAAPSFDPFENNDKQSDDLVWDEECLLTLREIQLFGGEKESYPMPFFVRLTLTDSTGFSCPVFQLPLAQLRNRSATDFKLHLTCFTLPPYRHNSGRTRNDPRWRRTPEPIEAHSPLMPRKLPPLFDSGMEALRHRVQQLVAAQTTELLRFCPLTDERRALLVTMFDVLEAQPDLVTRERWDPLLCREQLGCALVAAELYAVAAEVMTATQLRGPGGPVAVWPRADDADAPVFVEPTLPVSHWLVLEPKSDGAVVATVFMPGTDEERRKLLRAANNLVWSRLLRRVNQVCLLRELHGQRTCSPLLEQASAQDPPVSLPRDTRFGAPGSLACPLQEAVTVPLHARVTWDMVRRALAKQLHLFAVEDRVGLFVYSPDGVTVWYFRVGPSASVKKDEASTLSAPSLMGASQQLPHPPPLLARSMSMMPNNVTAVALTSSTAGASNVGPQEPASLTISFHGHSSPPASFVAEIARLMQVTLQATTVQALAELVLRAPSLRMTAADLEFLRSEHPCTHVKLVLPAALRLLRARLWTLLGEAALLELYPFHRELAERVLPNAYLHVSPGHDGVALVQVYCRGPRVPDADASDEDPLSLPAVCEALLEPLPEWQPVAVPWSVEQCDHASAVEDDDDAAANVAVHVVVWTRGNLQPLSVMNIMAQTLNVVRADLGLELASRTRQRIGAAAPTPALADWLWTLFERSAAARPALSFRIKGLSTIASHLAPMCKSITSTLEVDGAVAVVCLRSSPSAAAFSLVDLATMCSATPAIRLEQHRAVYVILAWMPARHGSLVMATVSRDLVEFRACNVAESLVASAREACAQYLSWTGLRMHVLHSVLFAKMGLPYPRDFGARKTVNMTQSMLEWVVASSCPPTARYAPANPTSSLSVSLVASSSSKRAESDASAEPSANPVSDVRALVEQLKPVLDNCRSPRAARRAFLGRVPDTASRVARDAGVDPVLRHTLHLLEESASLASRVPVTARPSPLQTLAATSAALLGTEPDSHGAPVSPAKSHAPAASAAVASTALAAPPVEAEAFYSCPRATPARLQTHRNWLRRLTLDEVRAVLARLDFDVRDDADAVHASLELAGRGTLEVRVALDRGTSVQALVTLVHLAPHDQRYMAISNPAAMVPLGRFGALTATVSALADANGIAADTAALAVQSMIDGGPTKNECYARSVLSAAMAVAGNASGRCRVDVVDTEVALPRDDASAAQCNSYEVLRYLAAHAADYGFSSLHAFGVEPVLCLSVSAQQLMDRAKHTRLNVWGLPPSFDPATERWTLVVLYRHVRGRSNSSISSSNSDGKSTNGSADEEPLRLRLLFVRCPASAGAGPVCPPRAPVSATALHGLVEAPVLRVLHDWKRDAAWRDLYNGVPSVEVATVLALCAVVPVDAATVPHLAQMLGNAASHSWDNMLSHFNRWRPSLLRPCVWRDARAVVILQRLGDPTAVVQAPHGSSKVYSVADVHKSSGGLLLELERLQAGGHEVPSFAVMLTQRKQGDGVVVEAYIVRRRSEETFDPTTDELAEMDQVTRAMGIWMWLKKRK